jgi:hypothetical protein
MVTLFIGIILIIFGIFAIIPGGLLHWGQQVLNFLIGCTPILAFLIGFIALLIGIAEIKDKAAEKKDKSKEDKDKQ